MLRNRNSVVRAGSRLAFVFLSSFSALANAQDTRPITTLKEASPIHSEEDRIWEEANRAVREMERGGTLLADSEALNAYIARVVNRLEPTLSSAISIRIIRNPQPNAMMFPNGQGFVTTGLIGLITNEAELAAVLGHEIAHFVQRHSYTMRNQRNTILGAGAFIGLGLPIIAHLAARSSVMGYSREYESQADAMSFALLSKAGYDRQNGEKILQRIADYAQDIDKPDPIFFASHPKTVERIEYWRQQLSNAAPTVPALRDEEDFLSLTRGLRSANLHDNLGSNRFKPVIRLLESPSTKDGFDGTARVAYAKALLKRNSPDDLKNARTALEDAISSNTLDAQARLTLGEIELREKNYKAARLQFEPLEDNPSEHIRTTVKEYLKWINLESPKP